MRQVHVVILTAITLEYHAVKKVDAGAWEGTQWMEETGPNGLPVAFRTFYGKGRQEMRVALAQAGGMAAVAAANALLPLVEKYQPQCVAMCGVCAGHPGKTNLGDVIAPDRLFFHDLGKRAPDGVKLDIQTYNLREDWKMAIEHFDFVAHFQNDKWLQERPIPYEWQENWVLAMLHCGVSNPSALPECNVYCPQWRNVINALWKSGDLQHGTLTLTEKGRKRIGPVLIEHRDRFPSPSPAGGLLPFKVHVAPMGSGNQVIEDEKIWGFISGSMRKTLGLEMEAASIAAAAHSQRDKQLDFLVMKGVMDFANQGRDDHFKEFAARASAECLLAFLRKQLDVEVGPGVDDLLNSGTEPLPEDPPPSALLNARHQVIPFHEKGRESILAELDHWCDEGPPVAVRLIHADGGVGKTRLAIEWMRRRPRGWKAGFLAREVKEDWFERLWALRQQVVVVVDYAESRSDLRALLLRVLRYSQQKAAGTLRRIRLLMLARNAGDWWQSLQQSDAALGTWLGATLPQELLPLATQVDERAKIFHEAAERFANERGKMYKQRATGPLTDRRFERVLYLHMAALAVVEGLEFEANTLMDVVLDHEERFWEARAWQDDVSRSFQRSMARQIVAAATLRGGLADFTMAERTAKRILGHELSEDGRKLLWLLHRIYQRKVVEGLAFLPTLEPDLLGEGMVLRVASPNQQEERPPPDWIDRVFPLDEETDIVGTGFEVLGRASAVRPDVVRPWIERLLAGALPQRAGLALDAAKRVGLRTAFSALGDVLAERLEAQGDVQVARVLETVGIPGSTVSLRRVAAWVSLTLLQEVDEENIPSLRNWVRKSANWIRWLVQRRESPKEDVLERQARHQHNLGIRLSELGRHEKALKASQKAVQFYGDLAHQNPDAFLPNLAGSLNSLSNRLGELGRREEALKAARMAVQLCQVMVQHNPDGFLPDLAASLTNLGRRLRELGQREEALKVAQETVKLRRALSQSNPDVFLPELATSLTNLGATLSDWGQREEALKAAQEAADLYGALAQGNPDAFLPNLAGSLNNLGTMLSELGRHEEALKATQESVHLRRTLAQGNPDAFLPSLATSLTNLANRLRELGQRQEALEAAQEAVKFRRALAQGNPDAFLPELAMSLNNLGVMLSELERREEALKATQEAVRLRRAQAQANPAAFLPDLADSLNNLGNCLRAVGQHQEALKAAQEAVKLYGDLVQYNSDAFLPKLAAGLTNLSIKLGESGRLEEALKATQEAVNLYRDLTKRNPNVFLPNLATNLTNLGNCFMELGRHEEALKPTEEAVRLCRAQVERNPGAFLPHLAASLNSLGATLSKLERREEAITATEEAVQFRRVLAQSNPNVFLPDLAMSLNNLGIDLNDMGRRDEALEAAQESVQVYKALAQHNRDVFRPGLAMSLTNLGNLLGASGRREEALRASQGAVQLYEELVQRHPEGFLPKLAIGLNNVANHLRVLERHEEALVANERAFDMIWPHFKSAPPAFGEVTTSFVLHMLKLHEVLQRPLPSDLEERINEFIRLAEKYAPPHH